MERVNNHKMSMKGKMFLAGLEGISTKIYLDSVNVRTISVGVTRSEIPNINMLPWEYEITIEYAFELFEKALHKYEDAVNNALTVPVNQHQFDALVSICYNIGTGGTKKSGFIRAINEKLSPRIIGSRMMAWVKAGGRTLKGLVNRRSKEVLLFQNGGKYYGDGKAVLITVNPKTHKPNYNMKVVNLKEYIKDGE